MSTELGNSPNRPLPSYTDIPPDPHPPEPEFPSTPQGPVDPPPPPSPMDPPVTAEPHDAGTRMRK